jgi:hypothetical protein
VSIEEYVGGFFAWKTNFTDYHCGQAKNWARGAISAFLPELLDWKKLGWKNGKHIFKKKLLQT